MDKNPAKHQYQAVSRRELISWSLYDFANSGYTTVILTTIFSTYFVSVIAGDLADTGKGSATFLWTLAIGISNLVVLLCAPVIGAIADRHASKKLFLLLSTLGCILFTALLSTAGAGDIYAAMGLLIISAMCFAFGENLIAAFLPEIAEQNEMGKISGYGWSLGYLGGLFTLGSCLAYIFWAKKQGHSETDFIPVTLLITAAIFAISATPTFLWLIERAEKKPLNTGENYIHIGLAQVKSTLSHSVHYQDLFRFMACLTVFQSGVATVIVLAAIYAREVMGFDSQQLIILIMVVNFTAAVGAFIFGYVQDAIGSQKALTLSLLVWIAAISITLLASIPRDLWIAANLIGLAMGASQSGSRALTAQLSPAGHSGEFLGLWGLANRAAAILGPMSYGLINYASHGNHRLSLLSTLVFFIVGILLLLRVNEQRGKEAARTTLME